MKRNLWLHHLLGAIFAFALSVSTVGCLVTGFDLDMVSMGSMILFCGSVSLLSALLFRFRYGGGALLGLSALAAAVLWKQGILWDQVQTMLISISTHYHKAYNWPLLGAQAAEEMDLALMVVGWWTAVSVSWCVCRRKAALMALPSVILPLVVCLIVTNTVPDAVYLYLLILGTALLLLTDWVRRKDPTQGVALTLRMALPVAAALAAVFLLNPRDGYVNNAAKLQTEVVSWFQQLQSMTTEIPSGMDSAVSQQLDLRSVGPKSNFSYSVMRVSSPVTGTLYLRGRDYDSFSGTTWESSTERTEEFTSGGNSYGQLTITTYGTRSLMYVPYYATEAVKLQGGYAANDGNLSRYSYDLALFPTAIQANNAMQGNSIIVDHVFDSENEYYLKLGSSRDWAEPLAMSITAGCTTLEKKVQAIGNYVRGSASYDLDTPRMSDESEDFTRWFLEESDTGYCVHFATAATVLLRAAGIPARYVEGYMVSCRAGESIVVSNKSAHAWAEYYDAYSDVWRVLEATPADANAETEPEAPLPTDPTETDPTEAKTEATQPIEADTTRPDSTPGTTEPTVEKEPIKIPGWLIALLLLLPAIILQGELRVSRKHRLWNQGSPNEKGLARWKQCAQLAKLLNLDLPEQLDMLAQKAKFSQHTLTREELLLFDHFRRDTLRTLHSQPLYRKWFLRYFLAVG